MSVFDVLPAAMPSPALHSASSGIDMVRLRAHRLQRLQAELQRRDLPACLLFDPVNVRYATGSRNLQVWHLHGTGRHALVPAEGLPILFEYGGAEHLSGDLESIGEIRPALGLSYFSTGPRRRERMELWAAEIVAAYAAFAGKERRLAADRLTVDQAALLLGHGLTLVPADEPIEHARKVKNPDEIACMAASIAVADTAMTRMRAELAPGMTENELWSILHKTNVELGGEWIETRLLSSGPRTNPWYQECSDRVIEDGDLIAFDTDMIGPYGYCADLSRTWLCGTAKPTSEQRRLFHLAHEQLQHNLQAAHSGMSFRELSERAWLVPDEFISPYNTCIAHGVGMRDEYPRITHPRYWTRGGYDGVIEPGMILSFHSYIGAPGGREAVYLEQQVHFGERKTTLFSSFPFEEALL